MHCYANYKTEAQTPGVSSAFKKASLKKFLGVLKAKFTTLHHTRYISRLIKERRIVFVTFWG
jgi:hypothetical protein